MKTKPSNSMNASHSGLTHQLKSANLKVTEKRLEMLSILEKRGAPMPVADIHSKLKSRPSIVTVYRALADLADAGVIKRVNISSDKAYYEYARSSSHHHHLVCEKCSKIEELEGCNIKHIEKIFMSKHSNFSTVNSHNLEFYGVCNSCTTKSK